MREHAFNFGNQLAVGWTWLNAANGSLATIGGDAIIWIPIIVQVLSFLSQLLQQKNRERAREPGKQP